MRFRCAGAALLFSWAHAACTAGTRFTDVTAQAICRVEHNRGLCRTRDPFAVPRLVFVRGYGACTHFGCVGAALLFSGARAAYTAATGFTGVWRRWQLIAELSTPETHARSVCCAAACFRALLWCRCAFPLRECSFAGSAGRVLCAQLAPDSQSGGTGN